MTAPHPIVPPAGPAEGVGMPGTDRRRFLGYVVAGATLITAADLALGMPGAQSTVTAPQPAELYDLNDLLTHAALATSNLIAIQIHDDGTASFALPRMEVGQGITTSTAMIIAEELDIDVAQVRVSLADARPELVFNQLTGGSNTTISTFTPIRVAAAIAKGALLDAAARLLGDNLDQGRVKGGGVIEGPTGSITHAEPARGAARDTT
uniref:molybdopterin cofactor-binding domain-containing protein n=1 Tax=Nocardioides massiliensis TaxID=1325935 RepID=UPI000A87C883